MEENQVSELELYNQLKEAYATAIKNGVLGDNYDREYLLNFEPTAEDLQRWPFLIGLGGILRRGRHPLIVFMCSMFDRFSASIKNYSTCMMCLALALETNNPQDVGLFLGMVKRSKADMIGSALVLDSIAGSEKSAEYFSPQGTKFSEEPENPNTVVGRAIAYLANTTKK
jgi:hypothetical protein